MIEVQQLKWKSNIAESYESYFVNTSMGLDYLVKYYIHYNKDTGHWHSKMKGLGELELMSVKSREAAMEQCQTHFEMLVNKMLVPEDPIIKEIEYFKDAKAIIHCTPNELKFFIKSIRDKYEIKCNYVHDKTFTVCETKGRVTSIELKKATINGLNYMFYVVKGTLIDYDRVNEWIEKYFKDYTLINIFGLEEHIEYAIKNRGNAV